MSKFEAAVLRREGSVSILQALVELADTYLAIGRPITPDEIAAILRLHEAALKRARGRLATRERVKQ